MLEDWQTTATWANSFNGDGIQADDVEAIVGQDGADIVPDFPNPNGDPALTAERLVEVTASVQAWVNGVLPNYGWVLINTNINAYFIDSAETAIVTNRPRLRIDFGPPPPCIWPGPTNTTVLECRTATFSAAVNCQAALQWFREEPPASGNFQPIDSVENPTATNSTLVISNAQPDVDGGRLYTFKRPPCLQLRPHRRSSRLPPIMTGRSPSRQW